MHSLKPSKDHKCDPSTLPRITLEGLKDSICDPSKGWRIVRGPSTLPRIMNAILRWVEWSHVILQPFEGLKDYIFSPSKGWGVAWSFEGLKDCIQSFNLWRITFVILRRIERLNAILQPFEGTWTQSFKVSKDCICNPYEGWRITCSPSTFRRAMNVIHQPFQGLWTWTFEGLKHFLCNPSTLRRIFMILRRVEHMIFQPFEGLHS